MPFWSCCKHQVSISIMLYLLQQPANWVLIVYFCGSNMQLRADSAAEDSWICSGLCNSAKVSSVSADASFFNCSHRILNNHNLLITSLGWWKCTWMCTLHPGQFSYSVTWSKTKYLWEKKNLYLNIECPWCLQHRCSHSTKCIEKCRQFLFIDTEYSVAHSGLAEIPYLHDPASWS
jgi:hypothetical protein